MIRGVLTDTGALRARWAVLMVLASSVLITFANIAYTRHVAEQGDQRQTELRREQDQRWCPLLGSLDQPEVPATTERGRAVQRQIHELRIETGC